ncbi:MAG: cardiolipin synthase ClsB [Formivibrio sp.]|nr:cardiolipin synthase ClsB [Formivibrio sp.]
MLGFVHGNQLRLLYNGQDYFPALIAAIHTARHEIFIESYLYELDEIGKEVAEALIQAAKRHVAVKLHLDGFGARTFPMAWREKLISNGVQLLFFRPSISPLTFDRTRLRRLHRKLAVIDGIVGFIGGINIISDFNTQIPNLPPRYDYAVEVHGPLVRRMHDAVDRVWRHTAWAQLKKDWLHKSHLRPLGEMAGHVQAKFVTRDNLRHRRDIEIEYLRAIESARHEIIIANAYFLPGLRFRRALMRAAVRGVRVILILQGKVDHALLHYASRGFYHQFLNAGMEIHEYPRGFMHAKVAVIDGRWSTIGSSNIDPLSLLLAREANLFIRDIAFSTTLREDLQRVLTEDTMEIKLEDLRHARLIQRLLSWVAFSITRLMMALSGYAGSRYLE